MSMRALLLTLTLAACAGAGAHAQDAASVIGANPTITLYEDAGYRGRAVTLDGDAPDLRWVGAGERASSIRIDGGRWAVCLGAEFQDPCQVLDGDLPDMRRWAFNDRIVSVRALHRPPGDPREGVTLYSGPGYTGRSLSVTRAVDDLRALDFNDAARSVEVHSGEWVLCRHTQYLGRCVELQRDTAELSLFRMEGRLSSLRPSSLVARFPDQPGGPYEANDGTVSGGVRGVNTVFFAEPDVNGYRLAACADREQLVCGREAADRACRSAGLGEAIWHESAPITGVPAWAVDAAAPVEADAVLVDLVCALRAG